MVGFGREDNLKFFPLGLIVGIVNLKPKISEQVLESLLVDRIE